MDDPPLPFFFLFNFSFWISPLLRFACLALRSNEGDHELQKTTLGVAAQTAIFQCRRLSPHFFFVFYLLRSAPRWRSSPSRVWSSAPPPRTKKISSTMDRDAEREREREGGQASLPNSKLASAESIALALSRRMSVRSRRASPVPVSVPKASWARRRSRRNEKKKRRRECSRRRK